MFFGKVNELLEKFRETPCLLALILAKMSPMIRVFTKEKKGKYEIIAVADHQRDLNNLRLMSYRVRGADKVNLNKDEFGGPYLQFNCDEFLNTEGQYDVAAIKNRVEEWQKLYG